jgi:hypothetical protein
MSLRRLGELGLAPVADVFDACADKVALEVFLRRRRWLREFCLVAGLYQDPDVAGVMGVVRVTSDKISDELECSKKMLAMIGLYYGFGREGSWSLREWITGNLLQLAHLLYRSEDSIVVRKP